MNGNCNKINSENYTYLINNFIEALESCLSKIFIITKIIGKYNEKEVFKNFDLEIEFELIKLNLKYLENILCCFVDFKSEEKETHLIKMFKLNDYILYEFKRLRIKYEEIAEFYFSIDQENKYVNNLRKFMETCTLKPTKIGLWFNKLLNHYLKKIEKILNSLSQKEFKATTKEKKKFHLIVFYVFTHK